MRAGPRGVGAILLGLLSVGLGASEKGCESIAWPQTRPFTAPPVRPYVRLEVHYRDPAEMPLGVGHIRPTEGMLWGWHERVRLPLYGQPLGEIFGFIDEGWLQDRGSDTVSWVPLGTEGLVETGYETPSFLVLERRADGWMRFRYAPPDRVESTGTAWISDCHLGTHLPALRFEPWAERLLSSGISPLFFRSAVPHRLRAAPGIGAPLLGVIAGNHHLEPLEVDGEWMRVVVAQPSDYCAGESIEVERREGWVKWRSDEKGPWVWYYTRGC